MMMAIQILGQAKDEVGRLSVRPGKSPPADPRVCEMSCVYRALVAVIWVYHTHPSGIRTWSFAHQSCSSQRSVFLSRRVTRGVLSKETNIARGMCKEFVSSHVSLHAQMRACHAAQNEGDQRVWERQHPNLDMGTLSNVIQPARESHDKVPERLTGTPRTLVSTLIQWQAFGL